MSKLKNYIKAIIEKIRFIHRSRRMKRNSKVKKFKNKKKRIFNFRYFNFPLWQRLVIWFYGLDTLNMEARAKA